MVHTDNFIYSCPECGWEGLVHEAAWLPFGYDNVECCPICWKEDYVKQIICDIRNKDERESE